MGKRGPKPAPTVLLKIRGNKNLEHMRANEPELEPGTPPAPSWLSREAAEVWSWTLEKLAALGIVAAVDRDAFAAYCSAVANFAECERTLQRDGLFRTDEDGTITAHPAIAAQARAADQMRRGSALFGLSPSDRVGLCGAQLRKPQQNTKAKHFA